ncbi:hypothetical protein [Acidithiobacillus thiooxidans]|uniref:hypothetical protein n=1 Tax=Acidithiobacillus thiooxidans TaxID=930 RepID=UPI0004E27569|nr:hypothetical protein [Acidithiobacillus thiooxidans]
MSEESSHRRNVPTEKMLQFAERLAARKSLPLPPDVRESFDSCKAFLDEHGSELPPSTKAVNWANDIALKKKIPLSAEVLADARKLSEWIDANK